MNFTEMAQKVAEDFKRTMDEEGFETFNEMARCYWWDADDIKDEVDAILRDASDGEAYIDEEDRTLVFVGDEEIPYKKFATMWRKNIA